MIRTALQAGKCRILAASVAAIAGFLLMAYFWPKVRNAGLNPLDIGPKISFVAGAFAVTAYNLRTRVIDLSLKVSGSPQWIRELNGIAKRCGQRLTNLVVLFTLTAAGLGLSGIIPASHRFAIWVGALAVSTFCFSTVHFVYVLFAFERMERFVLDEAQRAADQKAIDQLTGANPDS